MNYSLSSIRKIDGYEQKIVSQFNNAGTGSSMLNGMKAWHNLLIGLDSTGQQVEASNTFSGFVSNVSNATNNSGGKCDVVCTVVNSSDTTPKKIIFTVYDCTSSSVVNDIKTAVQTLTGITWCGVFYLTSAIITIHS